MQIYLHQAGEKRGPFTVYDVAEEVRSGRATADTMGWYKGCDGWARLADLPAVSSIFAEAPPRAEEVRAEEVAGRRARLAPERMRSSVRLWARLLDLFLLEWVILMAALGTGLLTVPQLLTNPHLGIQLLPAAVLVVLEGFLISAFGTTPGKWLLRVRVVRDGGGKIPLGTSFYRALTVWWRGVGFWLVPLNLFMMALAQAALLSTGKTPWDEACGLHVDCGKLDRKRVFLIIGVLLLLMVAMNMVFGGQMLEAWEASKKG